MSDRSMRLRSSYAAHVWAWDLSLAAVALALVSISTYVGVRVNEASGVAGPSMAHSLWWSAAMTVPLATRRRFPAMSLTVLTLGFAVQRWLLVPEFSVSSFVYLIALASAGSWIAVRRRRDLVRGASIAVMTAVLIGDTVRTEAPPEFEAIINSAFAFGVAYNVAFFAAGWVIGDIFRTRREREEALVERTQQLEIERELRARRAVMDERLRIARELHDVVAHHVSVMGVQAGGARRVLDKDRNAAAEALGTIETSSRQAIDELRRLVSFLRTDGEHDSFEPQPGLERVPELIDDARRSGLVVDQRVEGDPRPLPGSIDVSAYRVVQEALTNTRKHAQATRVEVMIRYGTDAVEVEVVDDGTTSAAPLVAGTGHGIAGMRERVALHGGHLDVGRLDATTPSNGAARRGFRVHARFPLRVAS
jgi:signal transduction histidine kinase